MPDTKKHTIRSNTIMKHTPGPYFVANESYCPATGREGFRLESTTAGGTVCDIIHTGHFAADSPEAHADLFAASWELLEALRSLLSAAEREHVASHSQMEMARAAIAKAEGRA